MSDFKIEWLDRGREPQCPPNPAYPNGIDCDCTKAARPACKAQLPYPAKRCGYYYVECVFCGTNALITTAGRPDDPRSVLLPCERGTVQWDALAAIVSGSGYNGKEVADGSS